MRRIINIQISFLIGLVAMSLGLLSCDDFFEVDIRNENISLVVPANGIETDIVSQVFRWEELEGASSYRLMIVTPDFANAGALLLDTLITENSFAKTLIPGSFEWRVRGENSVYQTDWSSAKFTIFATEDLARQSVSLSSPAENYFTSQTVLSVRWDALYNADSYEIRVYKNEWNGALLFDPVIATEGSAELTLPEGEVWWGVKAVNDVSETQFATRRLVVDITSPITPTLIKPLNNAELSDKEVDFSWSSNDVTWTAVRDSLFIYYDSSLTEIVSKTAITDKKATIELTSGKSYYWRVNSTDKAGNTGSYSLTYQFSIE